MKETAKLRKIITKRGTLEILFGYVEGGTHLLHI